MPESWEAVRPARSGRPVVPGAQAQPIPSLDLANPEVRITPRLLQSRDMGMTATELGYAVNALVDGAYASDYFVEGEKVDLSILGNTRTVQPYTGPGRPDRRDARGTTGSAAGAGRHPA